MIGWSTMRAPCDQRLASLTYPYESEPPAMNAPFARASAMIATERHAADGAAKRPNAGNRLTSASRFAPMVRRRCPAGASAHVMTALAIAMMDDARGLRDDR